GAVRTLGEQLRVFLGLEASDSLALGEDVMQPLPSEVPETDELTANALRNRPEASALRALVETQQLAVRLEKGKQLPSLMVTGAYDYANPNQRVFPLEEK